MVVFRIAAPLLPVVLLLSLVSCEEDAASPEQTVQKFLRAAALGEGRDLFELLAPRTQDRLRLLAKRATAYASGRRRFAPEDLLATSLTKPKDELGQIKLLSVVGNRARVQLQDPERKRTEVWTLLRVSGKWRVLLPERLFESEAPSPATSRPTPPPAR